MPPVAQAPTSGEVFNVYPHGVCRAVKVAGRSIDGVIDTTLKVARENDRRGCAIGAAIGSGESCDLHRNADLQIGDILRKILREPKAPVCGVSDDGQGKGVRSVGLDDRGGIEIRRVKTSVPASRYAA